jgi:exopolyphosphatase / guanosine-5'-triphosphate,3'-diphosphate pyrophosphatase
MDGFAVIDIGTNSIRLGVVQPEGELTYQLLTQQKEVVRLGEGEFTANRLTPEAMERGLLVVQKFVDVARGYGVAEEDMVVLGTAALREAANQQEFVERAREDAGVKVHVISGAEEARLIYLGVVSGLDLGDQRALVLDIGGGSTEMSAGEQSGPDLLESLKVGAIRVAGLFTDGETGPIEPQLYGRMQNYVRGMAVHSVKRVRDSGFDVMFGSSGTIQNLAEIATRARGDGSMLRGMFVTLDELSEQAARLCELSLEQRRKVPGINPERADIIIAGAAVLTTLMAEVGGTRIYPSGRALREGIIVDRLARRGGIPEYPGESVRLRSVFQLARRCQFEEAHSAVVARLALSLFDQFRDLDLHPYGEAERELLYYAAILHDIGGFVSYSDHHRHGYYLVRNSPLLGFDTTEIGMLAGMVLHHRKGLPKKKSGPLAELGRHEREVVTTLSTLLRLAESLDRGHLDEVREVRCRLDATGEELVLELVSDADCQLELWGLENHRAVVREVFGKRLTACRVPSGTFAEAGIPPG